MKTLAQKSVITLPGSENVTAVPFPSLVAPLFDVALTSESLIASRHAVRIGETKYEIPKFLLLGQRGGGKPIRIGLFAGLDPEAVETTLALTRLLLQFELSPALARDYAVFAYPVVNLRAFDTAPVSLSQFEARCASERPGEDVRFFQSELASWSFDGLITLRADGQATGFHAVSRSEVLSREVVAPSLAAIAPSLPLTARPASVRPADRYARLADLAQGRLTVPPGSRPYPFEIEVFSPTHLPVEERVTGLFLTLQEIFRNYRRFISHAQNI